MEVRSSGRMESPLGYHSWIAGFLTCGRESGRGTLLGRQFDWGGRLLKGNGGAQRLAQHGRKSCGECKRIHMGVKRYFDIFIIIKMNCNRGNNRDQKKQGRNNA